MRTYSFYFIAITTTLASAGALADASMGRYRRDDGNWFFQAMEAFAGITC